MLLPYVIWEKNCCTKAFLVINWLLKLCSCTNHSQKQKQNGSLTNQYYFFMLIFLVLHLMTSCHAGLLKQIVHVNMTNDLVPREDHTFHCKSKDSDLQKHVIHYQDDYEFKFRLTFFGTTLFYCSFKWATADVRWPCFSMHDHKKCCGSAGWVMILWVLEKCKSGDKQMYKK